MPVWKSHPATAWRKHVLPAASKNQRWVNDSSPVSQEIALSKRELFGLIIMAHLYKHSGTMWRVGYNSDDAEPNDGCIVSEHLIKRFEHKVIVQESEEEVLEAIISTYHKYSQKGPNYGKDRMLLIQPNKPADHGGLVRISDLTREIDGQCNFDRVLTVSNVSEKGKAGQIWVMHVIQHHPQVGRGIAEVNFDTSLGTAVVSHCGIGL